MQKVVIFMVQYMNLGQNYNKCKNRGEKSQLTKMARKIQIHKY
jgi:hypothetical protein